MAGRLAGKAAVVTGGAGGIGVATARLFRAEGARVAIVDRDPEGLEAAEAALDGEALAVAADVADEAEARRAVAEAASGLGGLSILVNNAGVREYGPLGEAAAESWRRIVGVNLIGAANVARAALPALRAAGNAAIVNVSSAHAVVPRRGMGQYDATKAALVSTTRTLAWEEAGAGIRVNAVCPGGVLTPFHVARYAARGIEGAELRGLQKDSCLMGRWADAEEVAWPILWLASDEASFVTGAVLMVDGGKLAS